MRLTDTGCALLAFNLATAQHEQLPLQQDDIHGRPLQVAIIGAGAAGSSAAYHLSRYAHNASLPVNVTIFEQNTYVGGRSTTVTAYNLTSSELDLFGTPNAYTVELGASIFVAINHILVSAVHDFNLSTSDDTPDNPKGHLGSELGIWDGSNFVLELDSSFLNGYWSLAKLLFRYGLAPIRTHNLMKSVITKFTQLYDPPIFPFRSLTAAAQSVGLLAVTAATGAQYLRENGVSASFAQEVVQASTRVNYAQNLEWIHGLETMVCMATDGGAMSVQGGNWIIFHEMVRAARAHLRSGERVRGIEEVDDGRFRVSSVKTKPQESHTGEGEQTLQNEGQEFDHVIVATPWQQTNMTFTTTTSTTPTDEEQPFHTPSAIPYVNLHVTLFTSPHLLKPSTFNLPADKPVPQVILTTVPSGEPALSGPQGVGSAGFFAMSLLRPLTSPRTGEEEYLYKIFSPERVTAERLREILDIDAEKSAGKKEGVADEDEDVTWIYRKLWQSYPYETPRVAFEDVLLYRSQGSEEQDLKRGGNRDIEEEARGAARGGVWYTGGMDSFISTMETNALMGKNVARLVVDEELGRRGLIRDVVGQEGRRGSVKEDL